ncbi:DUF3006 family protein [Deinococcus petrolearius]|uniref:DUF3006 family protein n=1 Tax=Deinococcus petrolearius TaxID=1751295 RepID=A0ABW1DJK0_9DEIO
MCTQSDSPEDLPEPPADAWVVDGLEDTPQGRAARLELPDGQTVVVPLGALPGEVCGGDLLDVSADAAGLRARRLPAATQARRTAAQRRLGALNGPDDEGEITL